MYSKKTSRFLLFTATFCLLYALSLGNPLQAQVVAPVPVEEDKKHDGELSAKSQTMDPKINDRFNVKKTDFLYSIYISTKDKSESSSLNFFSNALQRQLNRSRASDDVKCNLISLKNGQLVKIECTVKDVRCACRQNTFGQISLKIAPTDEEFASEGVFIETGETCSIKETPTHSFRNSIINLQSNFNRDLKSFIDIENPMVTGRGDTISSSFDFSVLAEVVGGSHDCSPLANFEPNVEDEEHEINVDDHKDLNRIRIFSQ